MTPLLPRPKPLPLAARPLPRRGAGQRLLAAGLEPWSFKRKRGRAGGSDASDLANSDVDVRPPEAVLGRAARDEGGTVVARP
jgi:hypothetical protein